MKGVVWILSTEIEYLKQDIVRECANCRHVSVTSPRKVRTRCSRRECSEERTMNTYVPLFPETALSLIEAELEPEEGSSGRESRRSLIED